MEDVVLDGIIIILKRVFKKADGDMDWINRAQTKDMCREFVKAAINLQVP